MRLAILAVSLAIATSPTAPVLGQQTPSASAPAGKCAALKQEWKDIEVGLGQNKADGFLDESAPRATMRAAQDTAAYEKAAVTLQLMEASRCALPDRPPNDQTYFGKALECKSAITKASIDQVKAGLPECDRGKW